jgi:integrase/recombinase XerD
MKLRHVDLEARSIYQDAREVKTKFSKTFTTFFFPVGDDIRNIVEDWVGFLRQEKLWGNDDPLFPATRTAIADGHQFAVAGLKRQHWSTAGPIRAIFREAFTRAGLPYFNPHSLRDTLVHFGQTRCQRPEQFKAWSQNLGHEGVLTTLTSYGPVDSGRQAELIRGLEGAAGQEERDTEEIVRAVMRQLRV